MAKRKPQRNPVDAVAEKPAPMPAGVTFEIEDVPVGQIVFSDFNANAHDGAVSSALKESMKREGLTQPPLLMRLPDGRFRCVSGEHRVVGWTALGHATIRAIVQPFREMTKEDEFNVVQNYNAIHGKLDMARARRIVKEHKLDLTRIDVLGLNPASLTLAVGGGGGEQMVRDREARLRLLAAEVAEAIAALVVDNKPDVGVLVIEAKERVVCLVSLGQEMGWARRRRTMLHGMGERLLKEIQTKQAEDRKEDET